MHRHSFPIALLFITNTIAGVALAHEPWVIDSQTDWEQSTTTTSGLEIKDGVASPTGEKATLRSSLQKFDKKCSAVSIVLEQAPVWQNWEPVENIGPSNLADAPVLLSLGRNNYWIFGRYGTGARKGRPATRQPKFQAESATLDGFDIPLKTTPFPNQFDAPGGLKKRLGGYHAWQSRDMVNWVHHGPVTEGFSRWVTTAEFADGKTYIYYDFPNDQDPHLYIDEDLTDGEPGKNMGMAFNDPSHGSDCAFIRDLDGRFHVVAEDWSPINAQTHAWDSPLATHAVSPDGINDFKILDPPVDERTNPTGKIGTYRHPHWMKEDPERFKTNVAEYEIHEPEQNAYGDWAAISIGGRYYLFCDFDPADGHTMSVGWFTSPDLDEQFTWCDRIGTGHPDPDICFAEGRFYLVTQQKTDYTSPGPWVEQVEARVGVDTTGDGAVDHWGDWQVVKEAYDHTPGFAKQIQKTPAMIDLSGLPEGFGFQFEVRLTDTTENKSKPMLDKVTVSYCFASHAEADGSGTRQSSRQENGIPANSTTAGQATAKGPYDGTWESLQKMPVPAWFDDGKIGIFIHWGPYSVIGYRKGGRGYAEHVPKMIYEDPKHYYPYVKERCGANPPEFGYKDIVPDFKAENWDPDAWAKLFKEVGATYVVLTAEHHDGWANWDSDLTPWNAADMGPKRDLVGDLGKAVRERGLKYAPSYHRERHTGFFAKEKYVVHSEPRPDIAEEIRRVPQAASLYGPFSYDKAFVDDYVARWKEIQTKYQPDFLWVDDFPIYTRDGNQVRSGRMKPEIKYLDDQVRDMITDFMNDAAARGQEVYCNNKGANRNWPDGVGCLEKDNLKLEVIGPKWQSCTTFGTSFGYLAAEDDPKYPHRKKSVEEVIHEMVEVVSRNGNFLINIGPKSDGTIPAWQVERLRAMGTWLNINGEAIYGTRYWTVNDQENGHLAFTTKGKTLYAIALEKPVGPFTIEATKGWKDGAVKSVRLIGSGATVTWELTPQGLQISPPTDLGASMYAWSFEIVTDREQHTPGAIQEDASEALRGSKKVDLEGHSR